MICLCLCLNFTKPKELRHVFLNFFTDSCFCAEIARQAAQMKLMRKLEKQALARAAKEARKQQGKL